MSPAAATSASTWKARDAETAKGAPRRLSSNAWALWSPGARNGEVVDFVRSGDGANADPSIRSFQRTAPALVAIRMPTTARESTIRRDVTLIDGPAGAVRSS